MGKVLLLALEGSPRGKPFLTGTGGGHGDVFASRKVLYALENAKLCKDTLEIELLHSFDLKPSEQMEVGASQTTPNGTDTTKPRKLNAPKPLQHAYATNGFIGRHEHDYVATGVDGGHPNNWPMGRNVLFFDVVDLFNTTKGARKVETASEKNLKSKGFAPVHDSSLGPGEKVFQLQPSGSPLLSTIIYVQRGTFIMKIAGSCKNCAKGSIESSLETLAKTQLARAVTNGFPGAGGGAGGGTGPGTGSGPPPPRSCSIAAGGTSQYSPGNGILVSCKQAYDSVLIDVPGHTPAFYPNNSGAGGFGPASGQTLTCTTSGETLDCEVRPAYGADGGATHIGVRYPSGDSAQQGDTCSLTINVSVYYRGSQIAVQRPVPIQCS